MDDVDKLRDRLHDLADKLGAAVTRTEVTAAKLEGVTTQLGRIEDTANRIAKKVDDNTDRITVLETRADEARTAGTKWGAAGGFVGGFIPGVIQRLIGGGQ